MPEQILNAQMFINGEFTAAISGGNSAIHNPADGSLLAEAADGDIEDVDLAVQTAYRAFRTSWHETPPSIRSHLLLTLGKSLKVNREALAQLESQNVGKPLAESRRDVDDAAYALYAANNA